MFPLHFLIALLGIIWVDLLLSGDNAVVIALVCRQLPKGKQRMGLVLGMFGAILARVALSFGAAGIMDIPGLSILSGLFLIYIAINMLRQGEDEGGEPNAATTLFGAFLTIAAADAGMSSDNVMAIAALSGGDMLLMSLGVLISIPFVVLGSALILNLIDRFPRIIWVGSAILGWVAGGIMAHDYPIWAGLMGTPVSAIDAALVPYITSGITLFVTLSLGLLLTSRRPAHA